jgi:hypothetical protein
MSNCISLISCDGTCPNIHNIRDTEKTLLLPYINDLVQVNDDTDCTYYVRNVIFVGFALDTPEFLCTNEPSTNNSFLIDFPFIEYRITSLIYNGEQFIRTPINYSISYGDFQCLLCDEDSAFCSDARATYNNSNAHTTAINNIISNLGLTINVFPFGDEGSFVFRIFDGDELEFRIERLGNYSAGTYNFIYDNSNPTLTFNGIQKTSTIVNEETNTCTSLSKTRTIFSVTGVTGCTLLNTFDDYVPVSECDVITIFPMGVSCVITNTLGKTGATRTATLVVTGGTPPYSFRWQNGNRTNTISNLPAGTYNATVSDYFEDFVIQTSCDLPGINCESLDIVTTLSYRCIQVGGISTGQANLIIRSVGGFGPYTYLGSINNVPTALTNNMVVNHTDVINVETTDVNGCSPDSIKTIVINCPPSIPPPPPIICDSQVLCPNSNTFTLDVSATTTLTNVVGGINPTIPSVKFNFRLSSTYTGTLIGSYKIYSVDTPNTFLNITNWQAFSTFPIISEFYSDYASYGSPKIELNDYVEFGFSELTPTNPTINDDPWTIDITPYTQHYPGYSTPVNGTFWSANITNLRIDVVVFDEDGCVHKGIDIIQIPNNNNTNTITINF